MTVDMFTEAPAPDEPPPRSQVGLTIIAQDPTIVGDKHIITATAQVP